MAERHKEDLTRRRKPSLPFVLFHMRHILSTREREVGAVLDKLPSTLQLRSSFAPAVPNAENLDPLLRFVDLKIDVATRLRKKEAFQR